MVSRSQSHGGTGPGRRRRGDKPNQKPFQGATDDDAVQQRREKQHETAEQSQNENGSIIACMCAMQSQRERCTRTVSSSQADSSQCELCQRCQREAAIAEQQEAEAVPTGLGTAVLQVAETVPSVLSV